MATDLDISFLYDVPIELVVELGRTRLTIRELAELGPDDVLELDRLTSQPLDIVVGDQLFGRGQIVVTDDRVTLKIIELIAAQAAPDQQQIEETS